MAGQQVGIIGGKPVRQQFGHRGHDLDVDIVRLHVLQPTVGIPASGIDGAKYLAAHDDRGLVPVPVFDRRPERVAVHPRRHGFRHKMGMHVDRPGHRFLPVVMHCDSRVDQHYHFTSRLDCF